MKIGTRLFLGFGAVLFMLIVLAGLSWRELSIVNNTMDAAVQEQAELNKVITAVSLVDSIYLNFWGFSSATKEVDRDKYMDSINLKRKEYRRLLDEVYKNEDAEEGKKLITELIDAITGARETNTKTQELVKEGKSNEALVLMKDVNMPWLDTKVRPACEPLIAFKTSQVEKYDKQAEKTYNKAINMLFIGVLVCVVIAVLFSFFITRSVVVPIKSCVGFTEVLASGDFSSDVPDNIKNRKDEMGNLGKSYQIMVTNTRSLLKSTIDGVNTLSAASTELSAISTQTASNVTTLKSKVNGVASAAEESSANATSIAASMEQTSTNISSVSSATEEMTSTIGEIANNSEKARNITNEAKTQSDIVAKTMESLEESMKEISKITATIDEIASQTNLLALNATIEAQRSGIAGKGFAVVASEVKQLSLKTAASTKDIKDKIDSIQKLTNKSVKDVNIVVTTLGQVNEIVNGIAAAIEEQSVVTRSVAENVGQAATGVKDANLRVSQSAVAANSTAKDVAEISQATGEIQTAGTQVHASASELSKLSEQLKGLLNKFKV
jgi:methyl-accepting chemotaxis protein